MDSPAVLGEHGKLHRSASLSVGSLAAVVVVVVMWLWLTDASPGEALAAHVATPTTAAMAIRTGLLKPDVTALARVGVGSTQPEVSQRDGSVLHAATQGEDGLASAWWSWLAVTVVSFTAFIGFQQCGGMNTRLGTECSPLMAPLEVVMASAVGEGGRPEEKTLNKVRCFAEQYLKRSDTYLCTDKGVPAAVLTGLAIHKEQLGAPLCPCRNYEDKQAEAHQGYWNCPCVPMRERKECHCMLFLTKDNEFAGMERTISMDEITTLTQGMGM
eukprot:GGOE01017915.1.p1 GENE.GGOE01017915.1~~GGOE01017915.1.p1  ORF type:complete len:271 (+),score=53.59 GGOE01017915.1:30-842(+)